VTLRRRAAAILLAAGCLVAPQILTGQPAAARAAGPTTVAVSVLDVSPVNPVPTAKPQDITVTLQLTNTGDTPLDELTVDGARGNPIANQQALDAAIAKPGPPDPTLAASFSAKKPITVSLAAGASTQVDYVSTSSTSSAGPGLCLCENRVYPLYFAVHATVDGGDVVVGSAQTFVVSFPVKPKPVRVGWVWPMLEAPHRIASDDVFTDDALADSVSDGRLSRLLAVVEAVAPRVPLTLVVDPDLIDELAVMASGHYSVLHDGKLSPGTGAAAAQQWLARLRAVLDSAPGLQLAFTPPADPDVATLTAAGLDWSARPSGTAQQRISAALGDHTAATLLSWPARGALTGDALDELAGSGVSAAVLSPTAVAAAGDAQAGTLLSLHSRSGDVLVPGTTAGIATAARTVLAVGGQGTAALPQLVAQLAVRAVARPESSPFVAVVPPPDLDPDPIAAEQAILDTTTSRWSTGSSLQSAAPDDTPPPSGRLTQRTVKSALPQETLDAARRVADQLPGLSTLFERDSDIGFALLPQAVQRSESAAWLSEPAGSVVLASAVTSQLDRLLTGVHVVRPADGTYTLGSADSPLPITVQNSLSVLVKVRVSVTAVGGIPGFDADNIGTQRVAAGAKVALHVPVHVDRVGRIKVRVQLLTPANTALGDPVELSVRSTALGEIGKVITAVAGAVLALALLIRFLRWLRRRRRTPAEAEV
jgi:hypothetical protein